MEEEGLVEPVRTEQVGRRPARTIYRITDEGRRELGILRKQAFLDLHHGPDALGVALIFGGTGEPDELAILLRSRRQAVAHTLEGILAKRSFLESKGYLSPTDRAVFRRAELRLAAELHWHDEFDEGLAEAAKPAKHDRSKKSYRRRRGKDAHHRS
jgi:DNA-binding PadR family transcriptional regulator